jgi:glycerophosphoryl diester phosphodiesterase
MATSPLERLLSLVTPVAIAHRGGAALAPENTMAAFERAAALGVDAIECDVHVSSDGEAVVIHDPTLDRTTDAHGPVSARTARELGALDAGYRFGPGQGHPYRGQGAGVPRLIDVLRRFEAMPFVIEIKGDHPAWAAPVLDVIRAVDAVSRVIVGGFSDDVLRTVRALAPDLVTSASRTEVKAALRLAAFRVRPRRPAFRLLQMPVRSGDRRLLTPAFLRVAARAGLPAHAWIVDDAAEMETLLADGVTGLISDRPDVAVSVVRQWIAAHPVSERDGLASP